jgi:hypothetical protein
VVSRGKKRMGYELQLKIKFEGCGKWEGIECATELKELCDDGSDPEFMLYVTKDKGNGTKFKQEFNSENI